MLWAFIRKHIKTILKIRDEDDVRFLEDRSSSVSAVASIMSMLTFVDNVPDQIEAGVSGGRGQAVPRGQQRATVVHSFTCNTK